ncbi:MAG: FAD-binding dehydrogenase [Burkholderiales bacterium RIFOXYC12_FULL_65_23]|uniref:FAD-dependent oxidoreductase n=1 Tax=Malikia spinosa TaxID=86180 RepID=UPI0008C5C78D|nr:MAG: FAD-binding dehydrogenase [Burkholderiales bacterium RIFOXYC12_FULL_65_23]
MQVLSQNLQAIPEQDSYDLVVIGAGGAGMSAALYAAIDGAKVLLVESTEHVGGTTAWSAGTTWVPGSHHAAKVNPQDNLAQAKRYLDNAIGERSDPALRQAFLDHGKAAVEQIEAHSELRYRPYPKHPDYISDLGGSTLSGRALEPLPFDGRLLGDLFPLIRPPIPEFTVLGGMMVDRTDINHLLAMTKSLASFKHSARIILRHLKDRLSHSRGTRLVMGNALTARLLYSLSRHDKVTLALNTTVEHIHQNAQVGQTGQAVDRVTLLQNGQRRTVKVRGGVVLASGGFNRNPELRAKLLPGIPLDWCPAAPGHTGQAHELAASLGAHYGQGALSNSFWAPVSRRQRPDGSTAVFPHFVMDRAKPGFLTVNQAGERFLNESTSYHLFGLGMQAAHQQSPSIPAYLVCDSAALQRYGVGMVRPGASAGLLKTFLDDGYLTQGATLDELANRLGINAQGLKSSVEKINAYARTGIDPEFGRGSTAYSQNIGDASAGGKNPNLGPLRQGPYYAVKLYPGDIGAATGFATDASARVLGADQQPVAGLYAVGNDQHSIMGGVYTAPGITIGPGLVFAYIATRDALARARA